MATPIVGITPLTAVFFLGFSVGKRLQQTHANEELRYGTKEENRFMLIIMLTIMLLTIIIMVTYIYSTCTLNCVISISLIL